MPLFEIEQYQIHSVKYRVMADSPADAIVRLLDCEAEPVGGSLEFIEIAESVGLDVDECNCLAEELRKLGVPVGEHIIPSIRSISVVSGQPADTDYLDEPKR